MLLNGWIDNAAELSQQLGVPADNAGRLYGAAHDRWGDDADLHLIGDYCAVIDQAEAGVVRLSRSPWKAPPLHYFCDGKQLVAASVPRALHAAGIPAELDRRKVIDNHFLDLTADRGWYQGCYQVQLASSVTLTRESRKPRVYYDMLAPRKTELASPAEYVEAGEALLVEACKATLSGSQTPGIMLSGGLDSSNVAARLLDCLAPDGMLKSFTFRPLAEFEAPPDIGQFGDDGPAVEAFAQMHPRLEPHFSRNEGIGFDAQLEKMFLATGVAPWPLPNMYHYHSLLAEARQQGCDLLLWADFGNIAISSDANHAYYEFLVTGKWRKWWRSFAPRARRTRSKRHFIAGSILSPMMPDWLWKLQRRWRGKATATSNERIGTLRSSVIEEHGLRDHARRAGVHYGRERIRNRQEEIALFFTRGDSNYADTLQGFEQIYGIDMRDVTAYRPLLEFCLGLPTEAFMHDGQNRWLARELGKGRMPEEQRLNLKQGMHSGDWHERMTPRLSELRVQIEAAARDPQLNTIIDFEQILEAFDDWPEHGSYDDDALFRFLMAPTRAIMTKRFVDFVSGKNSG